MTIRGSTAKWVSKLIRTSGPERVSQSPTSDPIILGAGNPMRANLPAPTSPGNLNFESPYKASGVTIAVKSEPS